MLSRDPNLNGTDEETITSLHIGSFLFGLAIDMVSGLVYYTEGGADIIAAMTLDGKYQFTLISEDMDQPQDIALDPPRGMMYWSDKGQIAKIEKAAMDGTHRSNVITFDFTSVPIGLAIDSEGERLFWCDAYTNTIRSVLFDGSHMQVLISSPGLQLYGIAFLAENVYFTALQKSYVSKIHLSDASPTAEQVGPAAFNLASGITAYRRQLRTNGFEVNSTCSHRNGGCEHLCLATPDGPKCACQDGFISGKECSPPTYQCPQVYNSKKGHIRSPGYPGYRNNVYCLIIVHMNNTDNREKILQLYVEDFNLQAKYDYLVIGSNKFAGSGLEQHFKYQEEDIKFVFVTDGSLGSRGFHFVYEIFSVVPCSSSSRCQNGGTCNEGKYCTCQDGYEGDWCEHDVDECASNPCENGGTCEDKHKGFNCTCAALFRGASHPCLNGGHCRNLVDVFQCDCADGFTGDVCDSQEITSTTTRTKSTPTTTSTTPTMATTTTTVTSKLITNTYAPMPGKTTTREPELSSPSTAPLNQKKAFDTTNTGFIVGVLVGVVVIVIAIGTTIYCIATKSRNRAAQQEGQNTPNTDRQGELNVNGTYEIPHVYDHLSGYRNSERSNPYARIQLNNPSGDPGAECDATNRQGQPSAGKTFPPSSTYVSLQLIDSFSYTCYAPNEWDLD
ncbi:hypothetical protein LSAT2_003133 [Lamellibrachia satsuma]|nr:hypothetical protein LSAT2_003133 [Lamellibrachia satsuma]